MKRVLLDTNLYIDWLNKGRQQELMAGSGMVRYLSAVVAMELRAGATKNQAERALDQLIRVYTKTRRLIAPSADLYDKAGVVLRHLRGEERDVRRAALVNDVLIALTTRALGATLFTKDVKDFSVIKDVTGAKVEFVSSV